MDLFRKTLNFCQLKDIEFSSCWFTWERDNLPETNIREQLDRGITNDDWIQLFSNSKVKHLPHSISDHYPLLISLDRSRGNISEQIFRFEVWWILEEIFEQTVRELWQFVQADIFYRFHHLREGLK